PGGANPYAVLTTRYPKGPAPRSSEDADTMASKGQRRADPRRARGRDRTEPAQPRKTGRPRHFDEVQITKALSLPPAFWAILDELRAEAGSYGRAFIRAVESDECVARMRVVFAKRQCP